MIGLRVALFLLELLFVYCKAANILILDEVGSKSHHLWLHKLAEGLINVNHNVTFLSPFPETDTSDKLSHIYLEKVFDSIRSENEELNYSDVYVGNPISMILSWHDFTYKVCKGSIESNGWKKLLDYPKDFKFDLIIHDYPSSPCYLAFLHRFNYPTLISATAFYDVSLAVIEVNGILTPSISTHYGTKAPATNLFERTYNYLLFLFNYFSVNYYSNVKIQKLLEEKIPNLPNLNNLRKHSLITLINNNPAVDIPEQLPANVIAVGGLHIEEPKQLPDDLQKIADNAKSGLVVFSLGSNIQSSQLGSKVITNILDTFGSLPQYTFIWKFEKDTLPSPLPRNVYIRKWLPQSDLIAHPKVKLLINHGGLLSTQEAIWYQVPILGIPIFSDQHLTLRKIAERGVGEYIYMKDLTVENFGNKIKRVISTASYRENMQMLSKLFRDQKELPMQRAIWWIEWVLRNPNATNFQSPGKHLNIFQRQSIDVISFLTVLLILIFWIVYKLLIVMVYFSRMTKLREKIE